MAIITISNAKRIIASSDLTGIQLNGSVYKRPLYFFNRYETNQLLAIQELLKHPEKYFEQIYRPLAQRTDTYRYMYEGKQPAYHESSNCPMVHSDYENFELPKEIIERGQTTVIEFRQWFGQNRYLLDKPDLFEMRMHAKFSIATKLTSIQRENTGIEKIENYPLDKLEDTIDELVKAAGRFYYASNKHTAILKVYSQFTYLAYKDEPLQKPIYGYGDHEIREFLKEYDQKFKKPLKKLLTEYYRLTLNPNIKLKGKLLDQLGFKPCFLCYSNHPTYV